MLHIINIEPKRNDKYRAECNQCVWKGSKTDAASAVQEGKRHSEAKSS